jgi:hypothetical protein
MYCDRGEQEKTSMHINLPVFVPVTDRTVALTRGALTDDLPCKEVERKEELEGRRTANITNEFQKLGISFLLGRKFVAIDRVTVRSHPINCSVQMKGRGSRKFNAQLPGGKGSGNTTVIFQATCPSLAASFLCHDNDSNSNSYSVQQQQQ